MIVPVTEPASGVAEKVGYVAVPRFWDIGTGLHTYESAPEAITTGSWSAQNDDSVKGSIDTIGFNSTTAVADSVA